MEGIHTKHWSALIKSFEIHKHTEYDQSTVITLTSTVLCPQAVTGHEECVEALLQHSANFLVRDCKGRTPVHLAAACGHIGVLGGLLHAAQSVETLPVLTDNQGYTPLHWACYNGTEMRVWRPFLKNNQYGYGNVHRMFSNVCCMLLNKGKLPRK